MANAMKRSRRGYTDFVTPREGFADKACMVRREIARHPLRKKCEIEAAGVSAIAYLHDYGHYSYHYAFFRVQKKFFRLRDEWKVQRRHESSTMKMVMLPAYQNIIGMGPVAVPFLLRELETKLDAWFWALMAITEANPVPEAVRGDGEAMAQAWLKWAKERGYEW
jgi:hypothetical protein